MSPLTISMGSRFGRKISLCFTASDHKENSGFIHVASIYCGVCRFICVRFRALALTAPAAPTWSMTVRHTVAYAPIVLPTSRWLGQLALTEARRLCLPRLPSLQALSSRFDVSYIQCFAICNGCLQRLVDLITILLKRSQNRTHWF